MQDPSKFRLHFKEYKEGKSVREIYGLPGYHDGKFNAATKKKINYYYNKLLANGFDPMSAVGILGNMMQESSLDPDSVNELGYSGLLLNSKAIQKAIIDLYGNYDELSLLRYLSDWTDGATWIRKGPHAQHTALYSKSYKRKGYKTPEEAAYDFLKKYERAIVVDPKTKKALRDKNGEYIYQDKDKRLGYARDIYNYVTGAKPLPLQIAEVGQTQPEHIISASDVTRVATVPTILQQTVPSTWMLQATELPNYTLELNFELNKPLKILRLIDAIDAYTPTWEGLKQSYSDGKLPGYQNGTIQQGHKLIPIDKARTATEPDYTEDGWLLGTLKRGANNFIKTVEYFTDSARRVLNGRGSTEDKINVALDLGGAAGAKAITKVVRKAKVIKPPKASVKPKTNNPTKVGRYYEEHPEEIIRVPKSKELADVVDFGLKDTAPKYKKQNKVLIGIDPNSIDIGYADLTDTGLGGYIGPNGNIVLNKTLLENPDKLRLVLAHEIDGHFVDKDYPLTASLISLLQYGIPFKEDFLASRPWFPQDKEAIATMREFRYLVSRDNNNIVGPQLDKFIMDMPPTLVKRYASLLGYGSGINLAGPDVLPFKQAVTSVPTAGAGIYLAGNEYKNGKLPGYKIGKNPSHAKMNDDGTFVDDYTKVFEDTYVTPEKVDLKRGSHTLNNFPEYLANRTAWMLTFMPQSVLNDKPLEQPTIDPFLLLITGGRFSGDLTGDVIGMGLDKALKIAINSVANATRVAAKTPVGKRTVETIMRTSSNPTPFDKIKNGVKTFDKNRSKAVLNYILTGKRTGDFGYYNSFAETPELAYTGFVSERLKKYALDLDEANIMLHNPSSEYGDAIDAYLYNKQIDPVYGFDLISIGNDFGPHGQYILLNYNKVSKNIPIYESPVLTIEIRIPRSQTSQVKSIENIGDEGYIKGAYSDKGNVEYDAAGHLKQLGTFANFPVARELDIWKYLPSDYNKYTTDLKGIRKVLQYIGTNAVDAAGTPIIVRTPWQYYPNYSSEFINKIAGYKDGKIAIKPANRGKFNATKKRTGKTTEELTHSKNPLTRKRAIFALNAKKWKH